MPRPDRHATPNDEAAPAEPRPLHPVLAMWFSDDPPWDRDVLANVEELAGRLDELRTHFGTL